MDHYLAQGRFLLGGGQQREALAQFEAAAALPEGQRDPLIHELLARTRYALGDIGGAVDAVRTAAALEPRMSLDLADFHQFLTTRFGKVLVIGAAMEGASRPEPTATLLDPELKRAFEAGLGRLSAAGEGSTSVYLPVGSYRVSGHIVEVEAGIAARMDLRPSVGVSGAGVYGERKRSSGTRAPSGGARPRAGKRRPGAAILLLGGGSGYGQQGLPGVEGRGVVAAELGDAGGPLRFHAGLTVGAWRAERQRGQGTAPPAALLAGRVGAVLLGGVGPQVALGATLVWALGGSRPEPSGLAEGYVGPTGYLVHGPEAALRFEFGAGERLRFVMELGGFFRESLPQGVLLPDDAKPHLSAGVAMGVGVLLR